VSGLKRVNSFSDLVVYQKARQFASDIFAITTTFPRAETYSLIDQIRRSSRSVGAQIAEVWAKRRYEKHFVSKLTDADGELHETQHWIGVALDCGYISQAQADELNGKCAEIGRMLGAMVVKADQFCPTSHSQIRESVADYFTLSDSTDLLTYWPTDPLTY
jgi:four helix bundle protein